MFGAWLPFAPFLAFGAGFLYVCYLAWCTGRRMLASPEYVHEVWPVKAAMVFGIVVSLLIIAALVVPASFAVSGWLQ